MVLLQQAGELTTTLRRTEAKAFFANERTFLHWLNTSVTIGSIAAAMVGVSGHAHRHYGEAFISTAIFVRIVSLIILAFAIIMAVCAGFNFQYRAALLRAKMDGPYDSRVLPVMLSLILIVSMSMVFLGALQNFFESKLPPPP